LEEELIRAEELGLDYVVLHPGSHLGCGEDEGITAIAASLSLVLQRTRGLRVKLLLEITAGQGSCLGCRFEHMEATLARTRGGHEVGICFDTCHAHASGYDLSTEEGYDRTMGAFQRVLGLERLRAFHLNDSKTPTGSHVDRHAEIGDGYLGLLPFWRLVNDARFAELPAVLETPSGPDKLPSFKRNLERLRALIGAPRPAGPPRSQVVPDKKPDPQISLF
jgi:deoxyribonuclease-4